MNCQDFQILLLEAEDPAHPPDEVRQHLAGCPVCRKCQSRLLQLEYNVPRLPIPATTGRAGMVNRFLSTSPAEERETREPKPQERGSKIDLGRWRKVALPSMRWGLAAGVAAALVLIVLGWWGLRATRKAPQPEVATRTPERPDPLLARLVQRDLGLAEANSPRERVEDLADLADDLHLETRNMVGVAEVSDLRALARLYEKVVLDGLVQQAKLLSADERRPVLDPIGARLDRVRRDAERLAREIPGDSDPLHLIAAAARQGAEKIQWTGKVILAEIDFPAAQAADAGRVRQWQRNRSLVLALVNGSLRLASTSSPLKRADCCNDLAGNLGTEIEKAAVDQEGGRAAELGQYFQDLLQRGVAGNLKPVRSQAPAGSSQELEIRRLGERVAEVAQPVEKQLQHASGNDPENIGHALQAVQGGWAEVEKALQATNPPDKAEKSD